MPEQFVNPGPNMTIERFFFFDFPCIEEGVGVGQPPPTAGSGAYCAFTANAPRAYGNVNLHPPAIESLYGRLGTPPCDQGHPFMKEMYPEEEDPRASVNLDLVLDLDTGVQMDHTGRLSGSLVPLLASPPFFSTVIASAVSVAPHAAATASIRLGQLINWLTPQPEAPNVWFWRVDPNTGNPTQELLYTAHVLVPDPTNIPVNGQHASFDAEAVYKLVYQWKFWRYVGPLPYPDTPPDPEVDSELCERLGVSGYDEAISFEVIRPTHLP